jgi:uncharacterized protein (TIGR00255 family)
LIKSMTAYGWSEYQLKHIRFTAEIRSLNNRYRDIILRIPNNFRVLEDELKSTVSSRIRRGRIEVSIQMENNGEQGPYRLELNDKLINSYVALFRQLKEKFDVDQKIHLDTLLQMKDVILMIPEEMDIRNLKPGFRNVLNQALDSLERMRLKEGKAIEIDLKKRIKLLDRYLKHIEKKAPKVVDEYSKRLKDKVQRILPEKIVDETRIAQEIVLFAERSDITEEIVRIGSHLEQFRDYLLSDEALGRRFDFLIQEIGREVNTIGSKASDSYISNTVVEMKAELEKLREQVQNVE